jgi:hypothetical protein
MQITCCSSLLVSTDNYSSYVPFLSTITNIVDLYQKYVVMPRMQKEEIWASHYYTHLSQKSYARCIFLLVPIIGNIFIGLFDLLNRESDNKTFVLADVKTYGGRLCYASARLQNDEEVVSAAVKQDGNALGYASERLQNDDPIVLTAIKQNGDALAFTNERFKKNKEVVLEAVKQNYEALKFASEAIQSDEAFLLSVISLQTHQTIAAEPKSLRHLGNGAKWFGADLRPRQVQERQRSHTRCRNAKFQCIERDNGSHHE